MINEKNPLDKHLIKAHGIVSLKSGHAEIKKLKRAGMIPGMHGNKVWSSCFAVMEYLKQHPLPAESSVLDLGCGWGVLSCYVKKNQSAQVVAVDADKSVEPFFNLTTKANGVEIPFKAKKIEQLTGKFLQDFDTLMGSDICFWDEMTDLLYKLIKKSLKNDVKRIYIADPGRMPFWALAEKCVDEFYGTVHSIRITEPKASEKHVLVIHNE